jgi:hypothetical protein
MGITLAKLDNLRQRGVLPPRSRILDIGSSNLYSAEPPEIRSFLAHYDVTARKAFVERTSSGSVYSPGAAVNQSFVGELLEKGGMTYLAFDIANGYRTRIIDLNRENLPEKLAGSFDLVLNFGTTEHIINQLNAFQVIHDAACVGGYIVHELPALGYIDHGYFCYTPRFFFDLAAYNNYEVIDFRYSDRGPGNDINNIVRDYTAYFPALAATPSPKYAPDNGSLCIILRKTQDGPLRLPMETSTSVEVEPPTIGKRLMTAIGRNGNSR